MRKENILVIVLIAVAVAGVITYQNLRQGSPIGPVAESNAMVTDTTGIAWQDYTAGMAAGKTQEKPVFLYFHAEWCTYCKKLKKTTFKDKDVLGYLAENFISIAVDADHNKELVNEWKVRGLPTLWFIEKDGSRISSIPGYIDADQFLKVLKYIRTQSYQTKSFDEFLDS